MFRKIGNPKSALWNNCVGQQYGSQYGSWCSKWAVYLARFGVPKTCNIWVSGHLQYEQGIRVVFLKTGRCPFRFDSPLVFWESKTGEENGAFSSIRLVILTVFLCLGSWFGGQNPATFSFSGSLNTMTKTRRYPQNGTWCPPLCFALNSTKTLQNLILWTHHHGEGNGPSSSKRSVVPSVLPCLEPQGWGSPRRVASRGVLTITVRPGHPFSFTVNSQLWLFLLYLAWIFWVLTSSPPWKHSSSNENH